MLFRSVIFRSETLGWAMTIAGVIFVVFGVLDIINKKWTSGGVSLAIGVAILVLGWLAAEIVLLVFGILIALKGAVALFDIFTKKKEKNILEIIYPVLSVVCGLMLAFGNGLNIIIIIVGVLLIVDGAIGIMGSLKK